MIDLDKLSNIDDEILAGAIILVLLAFVGGVIAFGGGVVDTDSSGFDYPEWADENNIDAEQAQQMQSQTLQQTSYHVDADVEGGEFEGESQASNFEFSFNSESQTALGIQSVDGEKLASYNDYNTQEQFFAEDYETENVSYQRLPLQQPPFTGDIEISQFLNVVDVEVTGIVEAPDGEDAAVYEVVGVDDEVGEDIDIEGEFHLSENGYFVVMSLDIVEDEAGVESTQNLKISGVGDTVVEEPEWVSTAREQTDEIQMEEPPTEPPEEDDTDDSTTDDEEIEDSEEDDTDDSTTEDE